MSFLALLAASFTFSATATGVEKGAPVEFLFIGEGSDRDYEALFVLDGSLEAWCQGLEKAGLPRGKPEDPLSCMIWPVGLPLRLEPALETYLDSTPPKGEAFAPFVYTGGTRLPNGTIEATTNMPLSAWSLYSLAQSPIVYGAHYPQGNVYNCHHAKVTLKKGARVTFTLSWDETPLPEPLSLTLSPGRSAEILQALRDASAHRSVEARIDFSPALTVREARAAARALDLIDSPRVKINGVQPGHLFFRAFLPDESWRNRQARVLQPFELTIDDSTNRLVAIDSDWSVEGPDPKLTERTISPRDLPQYPDTDTCFIYAAEDVLLSRLYEGIDAFRNSKVRTWYVLIKE